MALILAMQGNARFVIWKTGWDAYKLAYEPAFGTAPQQFHNSTVYAREFGQNLTTFSEWFRFHELVTFYNYQPNLTYMSHLDFDTVSGQNQARQIWESISFEAVLFMFDVYDIAVPNSDTGYESARDLYNAAINVFDGVTFVYYLVGTGSVLILLGVMLWFGKSHKSRYEWVTLGLRVVAGIALTLITLTKTGSGNAAYNIIDRNWLIPIVLIVYAIGEYLVDSCVNMLLHSVSVNCATDARCSSHTT